MSQLNSTVLATGVFIKQENGVQQAILPLQQQQPVFPSLILTTPRNFRGETGGDDLLMEIGS
jgi:hypothetical protein